MCSKYSWWNHHLIFIVFWVVYEILFPMVFFIERASCGQWAQRMTEGTLAAGKCYSASLWTGSSLCLPDVWWVESSPSHSQVVPSLAGPVLFCRRSEQAFQVGRGGGWWLGWLPFSVALPGPLNFFPIFTEGDGVDLNGWNLMVLFKIRGRGPYTAADL